MLRETVKIIQLGMADAGTPGDFPAIFVLQGMTLNKDKVFTEAAIRNGAGKFQGRPIYIDHPTTSEMMDRRGGRSIRDLVGVITSSGVSEFQVDGESRLGIGGTVRLAGYSEWIVSLMKDGVYPGDLSLVAYLSGEYDELGVFRVDTFEEVISVDFVDEAAAGGQLFLRQSRTQESVVLDEKASFSKLPEIIFLDSQTHQALLDRGGVLLAVEAVKHSSDLIRPEPENTEEMETTLKYDELLKSPELLSAIRNVVLDEIKSHTPTPPAPEEDEPKETDEVPETVHATESQLRDEILAIGLSTESVSHLLSSLKPTLLSLSAEVALSKAKEAAKAELMYLESIGAPMVTNTGAEDEDDDVEPDVKSYEEVLSTFRMVRSSRAHNGSKQENG